MVNYNYNKIVRILKAAPKEQSRRIGWKSCPTFAFVIPDKSTNLNSKLTKLQHLTLSVTDNMEITKKRTTPQSHTLCSTFFILLKR